MQRSAKTNLFLTAVNSSWGLTCSDEESRQGEFYQPLVSLLEKKASRDQLSQMGATLVKAAEMLQSFRRMDELQQVSNMLLTLPLADEYKAIGVYYQAICTHNFGRGDMTKAAALLESMKSQAPAIYRHRAILALGAIANRKGDVKSTVELYRQATIIATDPEEYDPYTLLQAERMIAVSRSVEDDHIGALNILEKLSPIAESVRRFHPQAYLDYFNSRSVELAAVGQIEEAERYSRITLATPFAPAYPEWSETYSEIQSLKDVSNRSRISIGRPAEVPEAEITHAPSGEVPETDAKVISVEFLWRGELPTRSYFNKGQLVNLARRRVSMAKKKARDQQGKADTPKPKEDRQKQSELPRQEIQEELITLTIDHSVSDETLKEVLEYFRKKISEQQS